MSRSPLVIAIVFTLGVLSAGGVAHATPLTQNASLTITPSNGVSCNNGTGHTTNGYWREFSNVLAPFGAATGAIEKFTFGIESDSSHSGSQLVQIRRVAMGECERSG
jgi:hypothetical protein